VDLQNPITWNKYAYAGDDPVNFNDRDGLMMDLVDDGGGGGGEWWCEGPWDPFCFGDPGTDPATGVGFAPARRQGPTLDDERKKRAAAIAAAIAAIAKKLGDQVTTKIWPTAINLSSMCSMQDPYGNYELKVTYQVISDLGTVMRISDLDGFSITESFIGGDFANDLNGQASTWSRANNPPNLYPNGTFYDYLAIGSPIPKSGTAYQEFTAPDFSERYARAREAGRLHRLPNG
jgi:hypothetical protein